MYQWNAQDYHQNSDNQARWAKEMMKVLKLRGNERILDIGCGEGKLTAELATRVPQGTVVGVDASLTMLKFAREKFPRKDFANLSFYRADASHLPFKKEFDVIVSFSSLHWIKKQLPVLQGIERGLKPFGQVFLQLGGKGVENMVLELSEPVIMQARWSSYFHGFNFPWFFYDAEEYSGWVKEAGLKPRRVELVAHEGIFTEESLKGWIRSSWIPYLERLPSQLREEFINEMAGRYLKKHPRNKEGFVYLPFKRLEIEAEKV